MAIEEDIELNKDEMIHFLFFSNSCSTLKKTISPEFLTIKYSKTKPEYDQISNQPAFEQPISKTASPQFSTTRRRPGKLSHYTFTFDSTQSNTINATFSKLKSVINSSFENSKTISDFELKSLIQFWN